MKQFIQWAASIIIVLCVQAVASAEPLDAASASNASPVGLWKTIDDVTGKPKSILEITESPAHVISGKVVKLFKGSVETCTECTGDKHNQPVLGMVVMNHLKQNTDDHNEWNGGSVLDPKNGKTYHCKIRLLGDGQKLNVRGYIGIPLFGRSQTWERVKSIN